MHSLKLILFFLGLNIILLEPKVSGQTKHPNAAGFMVVRGYVIDSITLQPLANAMVAIKNAKEGALITSGYTGKSGEYKLSITKGALKVKVEASLSGYVSGTSEIFSYEVKKDTILLNHIYLRKVLEKTNIASTVNPILKMDTIPVTQFVENKLRLLRMYPSLGAINLFYALNPHLKGMSRIAENYIIKEPVFPYFKDDRKQFNKKFKKDKKKGEPFISGNQAPDIGEISSMAMFTSPNVEYDPELVRDVEKIKFNASGSNSFSNDGSNAHDLTHFENRNVMFDSRGRVKKFVYVFWKYGERDSIITTGPEVENRFRVVYFSDRTRDTPNVASDATYGYAPMIAARYYIKVYDQKGDPEQPIHVSDTEIDTEIYYQSHDIISFLFSRWIKIPIQIL